MLSRSESHLFFSLSRFAITRVGRVARAGRMQVFLRRLSVVPGLRILDLGGRPEIWESVTTPLDLTILNLPGETGAHLPSRHRTRFVEGDACRAAFPDQSFDIVFSNSVIEHVGPAERQRLFAHEVQRIGRSFWIQTPSRHFPIEAHTGMPFWWHYPPGVREHFLMRWRRSLPAWAASMADTRVLDRSDLRRLFPGAALWVESFAGIPKSYAAYSPLKARMILP